MGLFYDIRNLLHNSHSLEPCQYLFIDQPRVQKTADINLVFRKQLISTLSSENSSIEPCPQKTAVQSCVQKTADINLVLRK